MGRSDRNGDRKMRGEQCWAKWDLRETFQVKQLHFIIYGIKMEQIK